MADGATDDHSWQEEACWDVDAIGDGHQEVPGEEEDEHVFGIDDNTAAHNVLDDFTFRTPENSCQWTVLIRWAPSLMERFFIAQSQVSSASFVKIGSCLVSFRALWRTVFGLSKQETVHCASVMFHVREELAASNRWEVKTKIIASFF
jgi:hypothetical protein